MNKKVAMAFDPQGVVLPLESILPLKQLKASVKDSQKYRQVLSSVREIGIIEPLIVFPQPGKAGTYLLLDGHVRLEVLRQLGHEHVRCLIATDDETYTYNKRVSPMSPIQEHFMILKVIKSGASEERIATVLNVDIARIREKRDLLVGICKEAAELLKNRQMSAKAFFFMRKMNPMRQIEVAELMITANNYSVAYVRALLAATPQEMLADVAKEDVTEGLTPEQVVKMEKEMEALQRDLKIVEESHGNEVLNLVLARAYLKKLFGNARVVRYLSEHYSDILGELRTISEEASLDN